MTLDIARCGVIDVIVSRIFKEHGLLLLKKSNTTFGKTFLSWNTIDYALITGQKKSMSERTHLIIDISGSKTSKQHG
jgi:hypothetical protein